ncbi:MULTISPECIES: putative selenate ABC transporter substrate-binding protein [Halomonadaceae]|uniref:putative selenate ABC transporter substrate-binding protein n=1 Tax=Halomonadaceae TaxID=28256 RepID=UPI001582AFF9|nr:MULTISPECIES: putative selenate ABC transporter substrate-binding protein [Halomonas]MDI4638713.1 putative selenate ABC transporter substrate-binding protein [Halomonas sp. BMC7]NUJ59698.1 putative selenate ABC transporter substrate-binding protein [Halomonas taeanensis]
MLKRLTLALTVLLAAPIASADTFVFTAIPDEDETRLQQRFQNVADYLEQQLEVDVRFVPVKSYAAAVTAFRNNQVQLAWFGGLSGVQARARVPDSRALAQGVEDAEFMTYFIAHQSTGLETGEGLSDRMRDMTFTFGSKGSTSGRLMPEYYLREAFGQPPEEVFSRVGFSGNHSRTISLVASGAYDLGAVNYTVWENEVEAGNIDTDQVEVVWKTPNYPDYQWTIRGDVDERFGTGFADRVQQALLNMEDAELLESFPRSGFIPASNDDYAIIESVGKELDLID